MRLFGEVAQPEKPYYSHSLITKAIIKRKVQGLRSPKNRSLHLVNEDFEGKHNAEIYL